MPMSGSGFAPYFPAVVALIASVWLLIDLRRLKRQYADKHDIAVDGWVSRTEDPDNEYEKAFKERRKRLVSGLLSGLTYTVFIYLLHGPLK